MKRKYDHEITADSWMGDDHTFCASECDFKACWRHPNNIHDHSIWHSFAYMKDTPDCELKLIAERQMSAIDDK